MIHVLSSIHDSIIFLKFFMMSAPFHMTALYALKYNDTVIIVLCIHL